jgi:membrane protease YdiL (CAAX protease family)
MHQHGRSRTAGGRVGSTLLAVGLVAYGQVTAHSSDHDGRYIARNTTVGALLLAGARRAGLSWDALGLSPRRWRSGLRTGAAVAAGVALAVVGAATVGSATPLGRRLLADQRADLDDVALARQVLVRIPIGTAAFEELAFRGVLLAALDDAWGRSAAVGGSSAAFGLWHVGPTVVALARNQQPSRSVVVPAAVVGTAAAGWVFAALRLRSGHLSASWLAHAAVNAAGLLAAARAQRRGAHRRHG